MKILRSIIRLYLSKFPITEGKKYVYKFACKYFLPVNNQVLEKTKHGFYLKLNLKNPEHQYLYFYMSHDERYEVMNLKKIIRDSDVCWDIGSNIGFYSFFLASLAKNGEVEAFEPISKTFNDLKDALHKNNFKNIFCNHFALGDELKDQEIFYTNDELSMGTASFFKSNSFNNSEIVSIKTIDNIFHTLKRPDFLKIDVEGFQNEVIKGGNIFFQTNKPIIMIEIDQHTGQWLEDFFLKMGYKFFRFNKNYLTEVTTIFNNGRNILFCKKESQYFHRIEELL